MGGFFLPEAAQLQKPAFTKPALSIDEQLELLKSRGLIVSDTKAAAKQLATIGYYRLSGYSLPLQIGNSDPPHQFKVGTTFEAVVERYVFDRRLRLVVMDAVERIEIAVRSELSNSVATVHGPHWYTQPSCFSAVAPFSHEAFIDDIKRQIGLAPFDSGRQHIFIKHFYDSYSSPSLPPCWMVFEAVSFGTISQIYKNLAWSERKKIADNLGQLPPNLVSWLHCISYVRNLCAHHLRLWNRVFTIKPKVAHAHQTNLANNERVYAQLVIMQILLQKIAPGNHWGDQLKTLVNNSPTIPQASMGFPDDWQTRPLWN